MDIKYIPSYASEYEFIICYLDLDSDEPDVYEFYTIADNGHFAEMACEECRSNGWEPIIIHNVRIQGRIKNV